MHVRECMLVNPYTALSGGWNHKECSMKWDKKNFLQAIWLLRNLSSAISSGISSAKFTILNSYTFSWHCRIIWLGGDTYEKLSLRSQKIDGNWLTSIRERTQTSVSLKSVQARCAAKLKHLGMIERSKLCLQKGIVWVIAMISTQENVSL